MRRPYRLLALALVFLVASCEDNPPPTLPPATPGGGFIIETFKSEQGGPPIVEPVVELDNTWQGDLANATGDASEFTVITNGLALAAAVGKRAPAKWKFKWVASADDSKGCIGQSLLESVQINDIAAVECEILQVSYGIPATSQFEASPNPTYISAPPSVGTISGSGLTITYGMPMVKYYTMDGTFVAQEQATSVASGGTSMQISGTNISQLPVGTYAGFISNAGPNSTWNYLGTAAVLVADGSVFISGVEQKDTSCIVPPIKTSISAAEPATCPVLYDTGNVSVTINNFNVTVQYGQGSTSSTVANAIAQAFNAASRSPVIAYPSGLTIAFQKKVRGTAYPVLASSSTDNPGDFTHGPSFRAVASGPRF